MDNQYQPDDLLTIEQFSALAGIKPATLRAYKSRHLIPAEDVRYGATPLWRFRTFLGWKAARPGRGGRRRLDRRTAPI